MDGEEGRGGGGANAGGPSRTFAFHWIFGAAKGGATIGGPYAEVDFCTNNAKLDE